MSSQYSSDVSFLDAPQRSILSSRTSRWSAAERIQAASGCSVVIVGPEVWFARAAAARRR